MERGRASPTAALSHPTLFTTGAVRVNQNANGTPRDSTGVIRERSEDLRTPRGSTLNESTVDIFVPSDDLPQVLTDTPIREAQVQQLREAFAPAGIDSMDRRRAIIVSCTVRPVAIIRELLAKDVNSIFRRIEERSLPLKRTSGSAWDTVTRTPGSTSSSPPAQPRPVSPFGRGTLSGRHAKVAGKCANTEGRPALARGATH